MGQLNNNPFTIEDNVFVDCPTSYEGEVVVPDGITDIGDKALMFCNKVNAVELPDTIEGIGLCAFYGCKSLESIALPHSMVEIYEYAFEGCENLRHIRMPVYTVIK